MLPPEPIGNATKRALEDIIDAWVEESMAMPDGEQRRRLNEKIVKLEDLLVTIS